MPRDLPDWGALSAQQTIHEISDLGELAARLGSVVTFDRRGDVMWIDEFECGFAKWSTVAGGTGASIAESDDRARNGGTSIKFTSRSDGAGTVEMNHSEPFPALSRLGLEVSISMASVIDSLEVSFTLFDGDKQTQFSVWWEEATEKLWYPDVDGNTVTLETGIKLLRSASIFHTFKLVLNGNDNTYERIIVDAHEYRIDGIAGYAIGASNSVYVRARVRLWGRSGENDVLYADDVIITQNEPPNP